MKPERICMELLPKKICFLIILCCKKNVCFKFKAHHIFFFLIKCTVLALARNPAGIYLLKVDNRNTAARSEICSKLKIKTPE